MTIHITIYTQLWIICLNVYDRYDLNKEY